MNKSILKAKNANYALILLLIAITGLKCATATNPEGKEQQLADAIVPAINKRLLFDNCWTTVGATGIVDQSSINFIKFGERLSEGVVVPPGTNVDLILSDIGSFGGAAYLLNAPKGLYRLRFPINQQFLFRVNTEPTNSDKWTLTLTARYKVEDKTRERIYIKLNRYSLNSPQTPEKIETIFTLDSDNFPENSSFQLMSEEKANVEFNFKEFGYFIDAQLIIKRIDTQPSVEKGVGLALAHIRLCEMALFKDN